MSDEREEAATSPIPARQATASADAGLGPQARQQPTRSEGQQATASSPAKEMTSEQRDLWDIDFGVKKSLRYHARRRAFYERLDNLSNVLVAITGASAFAVLIGGEGEIAKYVSGAVAILALVAAVLGFGRRAREYQDLYRRFSELAIKIATFEHPTAQDIARLRAERLSLEAEEPYIVDALERQCWNEEAEARGYDKENLQPLSAAQRLRLCFT
jgi:hypothetical protein